MVIKSLNHLWLVDSWVLSRADMVWDVSGGRYNGSIVVDVSIRSIRAIRAIREGFGFVRGRRRTVRGEVQQHSTEK